MSLSSVHCNHRIPFRGILEPPLDQGKLRGVGRVTIIGSPLDGSQERAQLGNAKTGTQVAYL